MKYIIDLPEELYEQCKNTELTKENEGFDFHIIKTVANGTLLSEELEKIIDEINELSYSRAGAYESEFSMCLDLLDEHIAELQEES